MRKYQHIKSLLDYIEFVKYLYDSHNVHAANLWFRGMSNEKYDLRPSFYRKRNLGAEDDLIEDYVITTRSMMEGPIDLWEYYCQMQHHGLPTRLLDWSKSPLVALFFSCHSNKNLTKRNLNNAVVYILNPYAFNELMGHQKEVPVPSFSADRERIDAYLPETLKRTGITKIPPLPIAIEPPYANRRINFQQGCFTIHGTTNESLEFIMKKTDNILYKLVIDGSKIQEILEDIYNMGIREDYIYQDYDSVARRVVRERFS